jgi:hypothetical protein
MRELKAANRQNYATLDAKDLKAPCGRALLQSLRRRRRRLTGSEGDLPESEIRK